MLLPFAYVRQRLLPVLPFAFALPFVRALQHVLALQHAVVRQSELAVQLQLGVVRQSFLAVLQSDLAEVVCCITTTDVVKLLKNAFFDMRKALKPLAVG